jgi:hypothetical protein
MGSERGWNAAHPLRHALHSSAFLELVVADVGDPLACIT